MPRGGADEDDIESSEQTDIEKAKKFANSKNPNNNFTRLVRSSTFFYLFMAIVLVIIVWWITYMVRNSNN